MKTCPFHASDKVVYRPSLRGHGLDAMASEEGRLVPGQVYKVEQVQADSYIVVEGYRHPGGGIYWTEFERTEGQHADEGETRQRT